MLSCYGADDCTIDDEHEYGGTPWEDAEHLMRLSPLTYVQNVTTPVLLMHGEGDLRVPTEQTDEFYAALKRLGKTAYMVRYPGEFHGPSRPAHRLDRYERLLAWFQFYRGSQETGVRSQEGNASTGRP
jgi:dipeptidyl aminopeptidase/acylaminoacyl peptidase